MTEKDIFEEGKKAEDGLEAEQENEAPENAESEIQANGQVAELKTKLEKAEAAFKDENDRFLRLYAEFDNYKKRNARDMQEYRKYACEPLVRDLLPVIDNLERALESSSNGNIGNNQCEKAIVEGVELIRKDMHRILEKFHVNAVEAMGKPFDPNFHEAIGQEESEEYEPNTVIREFQKGYVMHERLIRPSMVFVAKAKAILETDQTEDNEDTNSENTDNGTDV